MSETATIALIGDFNPEVTAHRAIPQALTLAAKSAGVKLEWQWVETSAIEPGLGATVKGFAGYWAVPASPYQNMDGVLEVIRFAREAKRPFLGTCGGYQHAVLEFARNVLGHAKAGNAEVDPKCEMPVINALTCALVEVYGRINFAPNSKMAAYHGADHADEAYHCSYGVAREHLSIFEGSALKFTGLDADGELRAFELADHPFFAGTAYQPERGALNGRSHGLIENFVMASTRQLAAVD